MIMAKKQNWIQNAIQHPGALTKKAKAAGAVTKKGTIDQGWLESAAKQKGTTGKQARLAETLSKLRGKGRK